MSLSRLGEIVTLELLILFTYNHQRVSKMIFQFRRSILTHLFCGVACLITFQANTVTFKKPQKSFRDLIIVLNDEGQVGEDKNVETSLLHLIYALSSGEIPFIVSSSLWKTFVESRAYFETEKQHSQSTVYALNDYLEQVKNRSDYWYTILSKNIHNKQSILYNVYRKLIGEFRKGVTQSKSPFPECAIDKESMIQVFPYYYCFIAPFKKEKWNVYQVCDSLILFVPATYVKKLGMSSKSDLGGDITVREAALGLKIDHLTCIQDPCGHNFLQSSNVRKTGALVDALSKVLVTADYTDYVWNIFVNYGNVTKDHGSTLCTKEFKDTLQFFNTSLEMNLFVYNSYYADGDSLKNSYRTNGQPDRYNFPIVVSCLTESSTIARVLSGEMYYDNLIKKDTKFSPYRITETNGGYKIDLCSFDDSWNVFFSALHNRYDRLYDQPVKLFHILQIVAKYDSENFPLIRYPGQDEFKILYRTDDSTS